MVVSTRRPSRRTYRHAAALALRRSHPADLGPRRDDAGKVAVIEPDRGHVESPGGQANQPRRAPRTAHFDQVGPLVRDDPAGGLGGQHEPVRLLGGNRRTVKPVTADPASLEDLVLRPGNHQHLPEQRVPLDVARLLQQVGPHPPVVSPKNSEMSRMLRLAAGRSRAGSSDRDISSAPAWGTLRGWRSRMAGAESVRAVPERVHRSAVPAAILAARRRGSGPRSRSGYMSAGAAAAAGQRDRRAATVSIILEPIAEDRALPAVPLPAVPAASPKPIRSRQKRIGEPLDADGGVGAVPAVHHRRVRQREKLGLDARHERRRVAAGQVGPAHRPVEEHIAAEDHALTEKADAARRVPGREPHRRTRSRPPGATWPGPSSRSGAGGGSSCMPTQAPY